MSVFNILLFPEKSQGWWILTHTDSHTSKNNQMTTESLSGCFHKAGGLSQELSTTSNLNLFPPFCKPTVYTGLAPGSRFSWRWLVVTHTREVCWNDSCVWSVEVVVALRAFLLYPLCTYPKVSHLVQAWAHWTPHWSPRCVMILVGNVLCPRSGLDQVTAPQGMCCLWTELLDCRWGHMSPGTHSDYVSFCLSVMNKGKITK